MGEKIVLINLMKLWEKSVCRVKFYNFLNFFNNSYFYIIYHKFY